MILLKQGTDHIYSRSNPDYENILWALKVNFLLNTQPSSLDGNIKCSLSPIISDPNLFDRAKRTPTFCMVKG